MDALALLCTLHAEGPRTLRLLREAGCRDIGEFLALDSEVVSALLDVSPAVARRLGREGRHLAGRLGTDFLEPEEATALPSAGGAPAAPPALAAAQGAFGARSAAPDEGTQPVPVPRPIDPPSTAVERPGSVPAAVDPAARLDRTDRDLLGRVLDRWREADAEQPAVPRPGRGADPEPTQPHVLEIEGVPHASLVALRAAGFLSAGAVAETSAMALSAALGCPFGDARRFQFLAARAAEAEESARELAAELDSELAREEASEEVEEHVIDPPFPPTPLPRPQTLEQGRSRAPHADPGECRTVLNWDFVAQPDPRPTPGPTPEVERLGPEAGGPFA